MKPILELLNVQVQRGQKVLLDIHELRLEKGEMVSLIGPNGAGKSTLLQVINLLLPIKSGKIRLYGQDVTQADPRILRHRCGFVFQEPLLTKDTVFNNVALSLRLRGVSKSETKKQVLKVLEAFHCSHLVNRYAQHLSGGEAQRVSLAQALVFEPELLLLDEPFTALDPATRNSLIFELKQIAQELGVTVLLVSHSMNDVLRFTKRTIVLEQGRIIQDDYPEAILRQPATKSVAQLVGMDNILPCALKTVPGGTLVTLADVIPFVRELIFEKVQGHCCLPGDVFKIWDDRLSAEKIWVGIDVKVREVIPGIGVYQAIVDGPGFSLKLKLSRESRRYLIPGAALKIAFDPQDAHIL